MSTRGVFATTCRRASQIPPSADLQKVSAWAGERGSVERAQKAPVLPFLEGPASPGQLINHAATISDGSGAAFDVFGCP
jgi:hypothetical protein